jgi:uncharacterized pyridoxamine 5'-phosphate oxidase family protein
MYGAAFKTKIEDKGRGAANHVVGRKKSEKQDQGFADNRPKDINIRQLQAKGPNDTHAVQKKGNENGLPENLKEGIENISGYSMDDVKVHYNSPRPAQLQAHAYTQGPNIHIAPGQDKHLPHEAWHVVQQKQGRVKPTVQMKMVESGGSQGIPVNTDPSLEHEADVMGAKALTHTTQETTSLKVSGSPVKGIVQGVFHWYMHEGKQVFVDSDTNALYEFCGSYPDGSVVLINSEYIVRVNSATGQLLEKNPVPTDVYTTDDDAISVGNDDMQDDSQNSSTPTKIDTEQIEEGVLLSSVEEGTQGLRDSGVNPTKFTTSLSAQIALVPIAQGETGAGTSGILEYKYKAGQIGVKSIQVGDKDRPETRFENQESHTVAWTLVRNGLMGLANQDLNSFLQYMLEDFEVISPLVQTLEGEMMVAAFSGFNILETMRSGKLPLDVWQRLTSQLLVSYMQVYQLSNAATYKRGKALGHGESHAMARLQQDEENIQKGAAPRPASKVTLDAAKLLDVQFRVNSLGVQEYAFAIRHWVQMLQNTFSRVMLRYQDNIMKPALDKQVAKSFKDELGIDRAQSFTVNDLLNHYNFDPGVAKVQKDMRVPKVNLQQVMLETLNTNFVANISVEPHQQGVQQERDVTADIHIQDMAYPHSFLFISRVQISDSDRPKTKFIQNQKSHTVPWTLTRKTIISFKGKPLDALLRHLFEEFQKLLTDIKIEEGIQIANAGIQLIKANATQILPIDVWQEIISELVRKYAIAYQVAESTTYINPSEAERALGHGEAPNMAVLARNEYAIKSFGGVLDDEARILAAIMGMFDAQVTSTLSEKGVKQAFLGMSHKLEVSFPTVSRH